jgi:hypothetical protein
VSSARLKVPCGELAVIWDLAARRHFADLGNVTGCQRVGVTGCRLAKVTSRAGDCWTGTATARSGAFRPEMGPWHSWRVGTGSERSLERIGRPDLIRLAELAAQAERPGFSSGTRAARDGMRAGCCAGRCARGPPAPRQRPLEVAFLRGVTQAAEPGADAARAERGQEVADAGGAPHGHYVQARTAENLATPTCQDFHRCLIAPAFDQNEAVGFAGRIDPQP